MVHSAQIRKYGYVVNISKQGLQVLKGVPITLKIRIQIYQLRSLIVFFVDLNYQETPDM